MELLVPVWFFGIQFARLFLVRTRGMVILIRRNQPRHGITGGDQKGRAVLEARFTLVLLRIDWWIGKHGNVANVVIIRGIPGLDDPADLVLNAPKITASGLVGSKLGVPVIVGVPPVHEKVHVHKPNHHGWRQFGNHHFRLFGPLFVELSDTRESLVHRHRLGKSPLLQLFRFQHPAGMFGTKFFRILLVTSVNPQIVFNVFAGTNDPYVVLNGRPTGLADVDKQEFMVAKLWGCGRIDSMGEGVGVGDARGGRTSSLLGSLLRWLLFFRLSFWWFLLVFRLMMGWYSHRGRSSRTCGFCISPIVVVVSLGRIETKRS